MGYCINMKESNFVIKNKNFENALNSLKSVFIPENMTCTDYVNGKEYPHFSWVRTDAVLNSKTLSEALIEIRYKPIFNDNNDIIDVKFTGEKYGDEKVFFGALAPYVEAGSYLFFVGEDGDEWQWVFDGSTVQYVDM